MLNLVILNLKNKASQIISKIISKIGNKPYKMLIKPKINNKKLTIRDN